MELDLRWDAPNLLVRSCTRPTAIKATSTWFGFCLVFALDLEALAPSTRAGSSNSEHQVDLEREKTYCLLRSFISLASECPSSPSRSSST